jgi:hypothetical protein
MRRRMSMFGPAMLALEAQQVIALRMAKLALGGPAAALEARRMLTEKVDASAKVAGMVSVAMLRGVPDGGADQVVRMLRRKVRANRRRLSQ